MRSLKIKRIIKDEVIIDHNFRIINKLSKNIDKPCALCNGEGNEEYLSNKSKIYIHENCLEKLHKCSYEDCPQYWIVPPMKCSFCSKYICYYHTLDNKCLPCYDYYEQFLDEYFAKSCSQDIFSLIYKYIQRSGFYISNR